VPPAWGLVASPNPGTERNDLRGVWAAGTNDVWAAGFAAGNSGIEQTLILHNTGGGWTVAPSPNGGSGAVVDMAIRMYFLHKTFPDLVSAEYTIRAVNYILGTHPVSSISYVAGVGTISKTKTYSNNRADNAYIPGALIPGYIIIKPDFPECIDDFGFLWFEDEAVVAGSASWVLAGNAADAITKESN